MAEHVETRITEGGVFYPITPSTEGGEIYQGSYAAGELDVWGHQKIAVETEGEHAAQGGATAFAVSGKRTVNFTSGQGIAYAMEQYYHAPGKFSTMVLEVGARALTKHALNVHCGHDDFYAALDTGWTMVVAKDAQQAADQAIILRKVNELSLNPGMNIQDGMLTTHSERTYLAPEADLLREFLGAADDTIECPTPAQRELFGPKRRRVPEMMDLKNPVLLGPVQNQEHHMNGVVARRNNFNEPILKFLEDAYAEFGRLTGRHYGLIHQYKCEDADTVFVSLGCAADNIEAACDYLREKRNAKVGSIHINVIRPFPEAAVINALRGKKNVIILERTDEGMAGDNPLARDIRVALGKANEAAKFGGALPGLTPEETPRIFRGSYGIGSRDFRPEHTLGAYEFATGQTRRQDGASASGGETYFTLGIDHPYAVISKETPSLLPDGAIAVRFHSIGGWGMITTGKNLGEIVGEFGDLIKHRDPEYDAGRAAQGKIVHHGQSEIRLGEKRRADELLSHRRARHHQGELRAQPRGRRALLRSEGVHAHEPARRHQARRLPRLGIQRHARKPPGSASRRSTAGSSRTTTSAFTSCPGSTSRRRRPSKTELQLRMQGNSFLGAFFRVSPFLRQNNISDETFHATVKKQYQKKFGRFGDDVVTSNMTVMNEGFSRVQEIKYGEFNEPDRSSMRNPPVAPHRARAVDSHRRLRYGLRHGHSHARATDAALRVPDAGQVRFRIPPRPRLSSARQRARVARRDGRRLRRDPVEIRRPPRDAGLHRRKLHAMHGMHHRLPGHRPAEHLAGRGDGPEDRRALLRHRSRRTLEAGRRIERHRGTRPRENERSRSRPAPTFRSRTSSAPKSTR